MSIVAFGLLAVMLVTYALLDGYDLGVGTIVHLFSRSDAERAEAIASIGPYWNGNEVWLIASAGFLFAFFPQAYATLFSGFYLPFMVVLWLLMFRGIALELRGHFDDELWHGFWDWTFSLSSAALALILGVALGNVLQGLPLDANGYFAGTFSMLLNPYALVVGAFAVVVLAQHGLFYLAMSVGDTRNRPQLRDGLWWSTLVLYLAVTGATLAVHPLGAKGPISAMLAFVAIAALLAARALYRRGSPRRAFFASSTFIASLLTAGVATIYPYIIPSRRSGAGISIFTAAPPSAALLGIIVIAVVGLAIVYAYSAFVSRRLKVKT